jgi:hypothetical protein
MRGIRRIWLAGVLACCAVVVAAPAAQGAFEVERFVAANCSEKHEKCGEEAIELPGPPPKLVYSFPKEPSPAEAEEAGYTQAGGHVPFGITHFDVVTKNEHKLADPRLSEPPEGVVTHIRTDVPPGLSTNPTAVPQCKATEFGAAEAVPGTGFFPAPTCAQDTVIGENKVVVHVEGEGNLPLEGAVYNLEQTQGLSSEFGVAVGLPKPITGGLLSKGFKEAEEKGAVPGVGGFPSLAEQGFLEGQQYFGHTLIEGHVEWGKQPAGTGAGDYHDYFEINVSPALPLVSSRLEFFGRAGEGDFITNATRCPGNSTTTLRLTDTEGKTVTRTYTPPVSLTGCDLVPFDPLFSVTPETKQSDTPDGVTTELSVPHDPAASALDSAQLRDATVVLPEGMTLNPSAAQGLQACTPAQARIHSPMAGTACPAKSSVGTVSLEVPDLPPGSLKGNVYLGGPESGPITGPPYTIYLDAESARYGVSVRLEGKVEPNLTTGRLTTTFLENPEQPFSNLILHFTPGALSPIANPLICGTALAETSLLPYTGLSAVTPSSGFNVDSNNAGGACASPLPFALSQSTEDHPTTGGANASFTLNLVRSDGNQYLEKVSTTLPPGLVGKIPAVPLCGEPQAALGTCSTTSQIGTATATVGSGPTPVAFSGPVYLTGPTDGAPYGMTVAIKPAIGPFSLGSGACDCVVTRATIEVDPITARVTVASTLPTIVGGVTLRMRSLSVAVNRQGFLINPTNCGALATESRLISTFGASQLVSSPFQASDCSALSFKPKFGASVNAFTSRVNGASFGVSIGYPTGAQANIKSVVVRLPKQLPSRLETLKKACPEAIFNGPDPYNCPLGSYVGGATVTTPVLPKPLTGRVFFVSHGGAAFPDIDMVLGGNGVVITLIGNTNISKGITTTTFASLPDAPVSSFHMNLPYSKYSALDGHGNLCAQPLIMPTTLTGQNGVVVKQSTRIKVNGCLKIVAHRVRGHELTLTVKTAVAGALRVGGGKLESVSRRLRKARKVTVTVPLSPAGLKALKAHKPLNLSVAVRLTVSKSTIYNASTKARFR